MKSFINRKKKFWPLFFIMWLLVAASWKKKTKDSEIINILPSKLRRNTIILIYTFQTLKEYIRSYYGGGNSRIWSSVCRRVCGRSVTTALSAQTLQKVRLGWGCREGVASLDLAAPRGPCTCGGHMKSFSGMCHFFVVHYWRSFNLVKQCWTKMKIFSFWAQLFQMLM